MATPKKSGKQWPSLDETRLRQLARGNAPTRVIGLKLKRIDAVVRNKVQELNVSLKPTNQSPYNRRQKS